MRHVVVTQIETIKGKGDTSTRYLSDKAIVGCRTANEAQEIADGFNSIPDRIAFAGVELHTQGGIKVILSYADVADIARAAKAITVPSHHLDMAAE